MHCFIMCSMIQKIIILIFLIQWTFSTKFKLQINPAEKQCFYQVLQSQQKYSVDTMPHTQAKYRLEVGHLVEGQWRNALHRTAKTQMQKFSIHKLTSLSATYSFCISNIDETSLFITIKIQSGLQLLEMELLPNLSDHQMLDQEIGWLKKRNDKITEALSRIQVLRVASDEMGDLASTKMIGFAIIGVITIIFMNFFLYKELKRTFKERKLI